MLALFLTFLLHQIYDTSIVLNFNWEHKLDLKSIVKSISIWLIFISILILPSFGMAYTAEFEIEEIITAIKQDIQTARMTGSARSRPPPSTVPGN